MACRLNRPEPALIDLAVPVHMRRDDPYRCCYRYGAAELKAALGRPWETLLGPLLAWGCRRRLASFARTAVRFDTLVAECGLATASDWALTRTGSRRDVAGAEFLPREGPLVIAANHPGLLDSPAIAASLPRDDLRILASPHRFWDVLPHLAERLILVQATPRSRTGAMRQMLRHLRTGGSLLLYPAGRIEADPALFGAEETRPADWSGSLGLLARAVNPLTVVPALVSGVLAPEMLRHPLARLYRDPERRRWLAATLQFLGGRSDRLTTWVEFGPPQQVASRPSEAEIARTLAMIRYRIERLLDRFRPSDSQFSAAPDWTPSPDPQTDNRRGACHR